MMVFHLGLWLVRPDLGCVVRDGAVCHLSPKAMDVLVCLAKGGGAVVPKSRIFQEVWPSTFVSDDSLVRCIAELRRALDDTGQGPPAIQTIPKRGYRLQLPISWSDSGNGVMAEPVGADVERYADGKCTEPQRHRLVTATVFAIVFAAVIVAVSDTSRDYAGGPLIKSVAVLPLTNLSNDPGQEYFVDGMTDELISQLAQIRTWKVISRTSMMRYKGTRKSLREIGRDLAVDAVLEGSVMRSGSRVRITVQLIDAATDRHVWSRSFERNLEEVLSLQSAIARAITADLNIVVSPGEQVRLSRVRTPVAEAYELYLKGWYLFNRDEFTRAATYFEEATVKDPGFALGYALLAEANGMSAFAADRPVSPETRAALEKARRLDGSLAEVHAGLGDEQMVGNWDWTAAEAEYRRAVELDPGSADAALHYALCLHALRRWDAAIEEGKRAVRLDPVGPRMHRQMLNLYVDIRRYDLATAEFQKVIELDPNNVAAWTEIALMYEIAGKESDAIAAHSKADALRGASPEALQALEKAVRRAGLRGYWMLRLEQLEEHAKRFPVSPLERAAIYVRLGRRDDAIAMLETAWAERRPRLMWVPAGVGWDSLRSAPRFQALLTRMGFPAR